MGALPLLSLTVFLGPCICLFPCSLAFVRPMDGLWAIDGEVASATVGYRMQQMAGLGARGGGASPRQCLGLEHVQPGQERSTRA